MRVAILCNGKDLALWQRQAVERISGEHELFILACGEPPAPRRKLGHLAYYALNLFTIRNRMTRRVAFPADVPIAAQIEVRPRFDGNWAELPDEAIAWLKEQRIGAVVKFGLGLLRVPPHLPIPILSFHHGDPRHYRGRPAGFWELLHGEPFVGQVVQILSNRLDAGRVVAFAESRALPHSYRRTLLAAYALSPHLLRHALRNLADGRTLDMEPSGRNYRLPGNGTVVRLVLGRWAALLRWLAYGAFVEKRWRVASVDVPDAKEPIAAMHTAERLEWAMPRLTPHHSFYADPFFHGSRDEILVEGLKRWSGTGELLRLQEGAAERLMCDAGHLSYPISIEEQGNRFVVPETSEWSAPSIYAVDGNRLKRVAPLQVEWRLIDPTPFRHQGRVYLFANTVEDGVDVLHLWTAPSLFERFTLHPKSPVRISARGSRMAGEITVWSGSLYRLGQDARGGYGNGIIAFRILELSPRAYREELAGAIAFESYNGPHTLNIRDGRLLFDFYSERVTPFAGLRRLASRRSRS